MLERFKVPEADRVYVMPEKMHRVTKDIFLKIGLDDDGAQDSTDVLLGNDLRGNESHGVSNGLRGYVRSYAAGSLNPATEWEVVRETSTTANIDAKHALGVHVGPKAMDIAIDKAQQHGVGVVTVFNTGHLAGCSHYVYQAIEAGMIGHTMTAGGAGITIPTWGSRPFLGTNPLAYGAPARTMPPYMLDIATTQVAANKIWLLQRTGATVLPGWITDENYEPELEETPAPGPESRGKYGMLPIGGTRENGSHKGFGLGLMNEIFCNELTGLGPGPLNPHQGGHFFVAYDIEAFTDKEKFLDDMDELLKAVAEHPPGKGHDRVVYPGLLEAEEIEKRQKSGIPYHTEVIEWFEGHCAEVGVECDLR